ncbi:AAA family ATPase [Paraburkholderia dipogonis]|uniref:AAA family ATPase n=1 Tax=Paraburkholderia dipogonis TaxID=1211383 RepID=A0ABW9B8P9_9BURK
MKLIKFTATGVHGVMNFDVNFNEQITLLVGINGSGKTTVLNITSWLLSLKFGHIATIDFKTISVSLRHDDRLLTIRAEKNKNHIEISLDGYSEKFAPILVPLRHYVEREYDARNDEEIAQLYSGLTPDSDERHLWDFILKLPRVTNITLERLLSIDDGSTAYRNYDRQYPSRSRSTSTPMDRVNEIHLRIISDVRAGIEKIDTQLTRELLLSSFMPRTSLTAQISAKEMIATIENIHSIERMLNSNLGITAESKELADYFAELRASWFGITNSDDPDRIQNYAYLQSEILRLKKFSQAFDRAQEKKTRISWKLDKFTETLNELFADSGKQVEVGRRGPGFNFSFRERNPEKKARHRTVSALSSGEKQLLILLTYVAFPQTGSRIIIIDEPELSLHLRWQEKFLDAVRALADRDLQLVIATHSPSIVGNNRSDCVVMPRLSHGGAN